MQQKRNTGANRIGLHVRFMSLGIVVSATTKKAAKVLAAKAQREISV